MKSKSRSKKWYFVAMGWDAVVIGIDLACRDYASAITVSVLFWLMCRLVMTSSRKSI